MTALFAIGKWCLDNWHVVAVVALVLGLVGWGVKNGMERDAVTVEYADFRRDVAQAAQAAAESALKQTIEDEERREKVDAEHARKVAALAADVGRMRRERDASRSFVPACPAATASPAEAAEHAAKFERAYRTLVAGLRELGDECSGETLDLNAAKEWAVEQR